MSRPPFPPWYRPKSRPLAEATPALDLSHAHGCGPLVPGLCVEVDLLEAAWWPHEPRMACLEVDEAGERLRVVLGGRLLTELRLERDTSTLGAPLRAACARCARLTWRLYLIGWPGCHRCAKVSYSAGGGKERDRANARLHRLERRLDGTERVPRHYGRRAILAALARRQQQLGGLVRPRSRRG